MRKIYLIVILILYWLSASAQLDYRNYHREIIRAEELLLQSELKPCLSLYRKTIEAYPKTFARDAFLAFQVACMLKDTAEITYFFDKSVSNGVTWDAIEYSDYYKKVVSASGPYRQRLEALYDDCRKRYEESLNGKLRDYILGLLKDDDDHRTTNQDSALNVRWFAVMEMNGQKIDSIIHRNGFPGEHVTGIFNSEVELVVGSTDFPTGVQIMPVPSRIFYHNPCAFQEVRNELLQAIKDGELTPREYALMYEWSFDVLLRKTRWWDRYYTFRCSHPGEMDKRYNFYLNPFNYSADTAFVNQCRDEIGMCTLEHEKKLRQFGKENRLFVRFGFNGDF